MLKDIEICVLCVPMDSFIETINSTTDPQVRWERIRAALLFRGCRLADVARRLGVSAQAVSQTARLPSAPVERVIAEILGCEPHHLFPERYTADGERLIRTARYITARVAHSDALMHGGQA